MNNYLKEMQIFNLYADAIYRFIAEVCVSDEWLKPVRETFDRGLLAELLRNEESQYVQLCDRR